MTRARLSGRVGAALDPCAAMQASFELSIGDERDIAFMFGSGRDLADTRDLIARFRGTGPARGALEGVWGYWNYTLGAINVDTPDPSLNFLVNGWLMYQVIACRMWGRSGFYQSGGAFGFRDQLQDAMAADSRPACDVARATDSLRRPAIPRRRRATLVASSRRPRRANAHLR